jgi:hypothetical protein
VSFLPDSGDPYGKVARLTRALAPGSYLVISSSTTDFLPADAAAKFEAALRHENARSRESGQNRSRAEFARLFDGMDLVSPGIVALPDWHSELPPEQRPSAADVSAYGAVARVRQPVRD